MFRSRLEARWAVFFDACGIKYEYEPEGFDLGNGVYYLPDFYLPEVKMYVEVKSSYNFSDEDKKKVDLFRSKWCWPDEAAYPIYKLIVLTEIPPANMDLLYYASDQLYQYGEDYCGFGVGFDAVYLPCVCTICGKIGFEFEGRSPRICMHDPNNDKYPRNYNHPLIRNAFNKARQARFEHGETPTFKSAKFN
jgi:hypothetical protein